MKDITIRIKGDAKDLDSEINRAVKNAEAGISRLKRAIATLSGQPVKVGAGASPFGVDPRQMQDFVRISKQINQVTVENAKQASKTRQQLDIADAKQAAKMAQIAEQAKISAAKNAAKIEIAEANNATKAQIAEANKVIKAAEVAEKAKINAAKNATREQIAEARNLTRLQIAEANNSAKAAENARKREYQEFVRLERQKTAELQAEARKRSALARFGEGAQSVGGSIKSAGTGLTATLTAPLIALSTLGIKSALEIDAARTKLTALEGSAEAANKKLVELRKVSSDAVGVTQKGAIETYTQLKGIGGVTEDTINKVIVSMGKLNSAFKIEDQAGFIQNLNQIFTQGFERSDIKEAIGRVPFFEQLLESAFGTKDQKKLKQLKESGKLTLDSFLQGMSEAVNNDQRIANVQENLSVKLAKGFERLDTALAPIGDVILKNVVPVFEQLSPYIQKASDLFTQLSPPVQTAVIAVTALAAALGPAAIALGSVIEGVGAIAAAVAAFGTFGEVAAIIAAVTVAIGALVAAGYVLYKAWETNFGGIRDFTDKVGAEITKIWNRALSEIEQFTNEVTAEVSAYWEENGEDIKAALSKVSAFIKRGLDAVASFWRENGDTIKAIVSGVWENIKTIVVSGIRIIGQTIKLIAAVINGDWKKAWDAAVKIQDIGWEAIKTIVKNGVLNTINLIKALAAGILSAFKFAADEATEVGKNLINGLIQGMKSRTADAIEEAKNIITSIIETYRSIPKIYSPSKVTTEIGEYMAEGLIVGMQNRAAKVVNTAKKLAEDTLKSFREAVQSFNKLAGAGPDVVQGIQATNRVNDATSAQQDIIKMRKELGLNQSNPLPGNITDTEGELAYLKQKQQEAEDFQKTLDELTSGYNDLQDAIQKGNEAFDEKIKAMQDNGVLELLNLQEEIDLTGVINASDRERIQNYYDIERLRQEMLNDGWGQAQIDEAQKVLETTQAQRRELNHILEIRKQVAEATDYGKDLSDRLTELQNGNRELSEYEKTLKKINTELKDISPEQKDQLLTISRQIDAQKQFNEQYEKTYDLVRNSLDILTQSGKSFGDKMKEIFGGIAEKFRQMLLDMAAQWLTSKLFKTGQGSGSFGGLLQILTGGGNGGVFSGNQGGGIYNFGGLGPLPTGFGGSGGAFSNFPGLSVGAPTHTGEANAGGNSNLAGILSLAGMGANLIGSAIGGRFGGVLSGAGTGLAIGAQIGSIVPGIGTVIGAVGGAIIGGIAGLFGGDPKRKADKAQLPKLQEQFAASIQGFQDLIADVSALRTDPDSALSKGREIRAAIASSFGLTWQSKKYQKISAEQIKQQLALIDKQPDGLMEQLNRAVEIAKAAGERNSRILPEFAKGVYISDAFKRFNGLISGGWTGQDTIPAMIAQGEMVLNPNQQSRVRNAAGFDAFKYAGIPNYANGIAVAPTSSAPVPAMNFNIVLEGVIALPNSKAYLESPDGQRTIVNIVNKANLNYEVDPIRKK